MTAVEESTQLSIYHLIQYPASYQPEDTKTRYPAILALHGHGSSERDLIGLAPFLQEDILWISGRGPVQFGPDAYDWYPVTEMGRPNPDYLETALGKIDTFITELINTYPIDPENTFLLGFSQGSMISMSFLLTYPERIKGIIAQSGYIPMEAVLDVDEDGVKGKPVIMTHGLEDSRMPLEWSHRSRDLLLGYGANLEYHNFHMDHSITEESLGAIRTWLERQLQEQ